MTKKEMKSAAKGAGFNKLHKDVLDFADMVKKFRKGKNHSDPVQRMTDMQVMQENIGIDLKLAIKTFAKNSSAPDVKTAKV